MASIIYPFLPSDLENAPTRASGRRLVFSKRANRSPPRPGHREAERDPVRVRRARVDLAKGRRRDADVPRERRRERADAGESDFQADLRDRHLGGAQQVPGTFEPAREQVLVGRLAEDSPEAAAEVARRDVCLVGQCPQVERLAVAAVDEVAGAKEVSLQQCLGHR
jgi:hypothetical protein